MTLSLPQIHPSREVSDFSVDTIPWHLDSALMCTT